MKKLEARLRDSHQLLELSGDSHNYQRSSRGKCHRVVCGTGGAFLHPTHVVPCEARADGYRQEKFYPDRRVSSALSLANLWFALRNPRFGMLAVTVYVLLTSVRAASPTGLSLYLLLVAGCVFFADSSTRWFRWVAGTSHALLHVGAGWILLWSSSRVALSWLNLEPESIAHYLTVGALFAGGAWAVGSTIVGLYLFFSLNLFGRHLNESFSALRIEDWKGFLRIRVSPDGLLEGFFFGIDRVPRRWRRNPAAQGPAWLPRRPGPLARLVDHFQVGAKKEAAPR